MSHELLYTSVPPGLIPGVKGYSTVARTGDIPGQLTQLLEQSLSDYRYSAEGNPAAVWSHLRIREGLRELSVLSRKTPVNDHSGRPSFFAHHVVLGSDEQPAGGPAWVLTQRLADHDPPDFMLPAWDGAVGMIPTGRKPRPGDRRPGKCTAWERAGFDPGWAGVLAEVFLAAPDRPSFVITRPDRDVLPLIEDAIALLPVERRWSLTFSTYFTGLPPKVSCAWRWVLAGSAEARQAVRLAQGPVLDLDAPGEPHGEGLVELARTGRQASRTVVRPAGRIAPVRSGPDMRLAHTDAGTSLDVDLGLDLARRTTTRRLGPTIAAAAAAAVLLVGGLIAWFGGQNDSIIENAKKASRKAVVAQRVPESAPTELAPTVSNEPPPEILDPKPEPARETPQPVAKAEPKPEPDPTSEPVQETRSANVGLPAASESADTTLDVPLPVARRYALSLRGLDDPETQKHLLVTQPTEPGRDDTLTVVRDPVKGKGKAGARVEKSNLARFWIAGDRLHFQWEPNLKRTLVEPAGSLRDCILEIRGGGVKLKVALRGLVVDPNEFTVQKGTRAIAWKSEWERPSRKLLIRSCQVKTEADWEEIPEAGGDPNHRRRFLVGKEGGREPDTLKLSVHLPDDAKALWPDLTPAVPKVRDRIAGLEKTRNALNIEISEHRRFIDEKRKSLQGLRIDRDDGLRLMSVDETPNKDYIQMRINTYYNPEILNRETILEKRRDLQNEAQKKLGVVERGFDHQSELLTQATEFQKAPIRVRLGIRVDGEEVEVGRIGAW